MMNEKNKSDHHPVKKTTAKKTKSQASGFETKTVDNGQETKAPNEKTTRLLADQITPKHQHTSESAPREQSSTAELAKTVKQKHRSQQKHPNPGQHQPSSQINSEKKKLGLGSILKGRFELLEKIGSGGMGEVYKALDLRDIEAGNSLFIAIKVLKDECKNEPIILKALHSEARKTRKLAHPNIVTVYDFDRDGDLVYMTMEFLEGVTLSKLIKAHPNGLEPALAMTIIEQLGEALTYAHSHQVIHSDFKPGNIIIDKNNHVKVLDFGVARLADCTRVNEFDAGILGGMTQIYASLEMLNRLGPDQSDDVYSLACVAYELFSGQHAFGGLSAEQALRENQQPKRIKSLNHGQWRALSQALEIKREKRTKTVRALLRGLHSVSNRTLHLTAVSVLAILLLLVWRLELIPDFYQPAPHPIDKKPTGIIKIRDPADVTPTEATEPPAQIYIKTDKHTYRINDPFTISFNVSKPSYIRMVVVNSKGEIETIFPNELQADNHCLPDKEYHIPPLDSDSLLQVHGPAGTDRIIAVASRNQFTGEIMTFNQDGKLLAEDQPEKFTVVEHNYIIE